MGYYFLDNPNPNGQHYYTSRRSPISLIVVHTAENLPDIHAPDDGAEDVAHYGATTDRKVSWHTVVDSDTTIDCLPATYTAWHATGYNSNGLGIELATRAHSWGQVPEHFKAGIVANAATTCRQWANQFGIPIRRITKAQADQGIKGFVAHADLDPSRRSDPGPAFDWNGFLQAVAGQEDDMDSDERRWLQEIHSTMKLVYSDPSVEGAEGTIFWRTTYLTKDNIKAWVREAIADSSTSMEPSSSDTEAIADSLAKKLAERLAE